MTVTCLKSTDKKPTVPKRDSFRAVSTWDESHSHLLTFCITTPSDWLKKRATRAHFFWRFESTTCTFFVLWLVHWIVYVLCDWLKGYLWFSLINPSKEKVIETVKDDLWLDPAVYVKLRCGTRWEQIPLFSLWSKVLVLVIIQLKVSNGLHVT